MVSFSPTVDVCEYVLGQTPKMILSEDDELSVRYDAETSSVCIDEDPCWRLSLMIKDWFSLSLYERECGYWLATEAGQKHLGYIIFRDPNALSWEYSNEYFARCLEILALALKKKFDQMSESGMIKTLFWNPNVAVKRSCSSQKIIGSLYEQILEYKWNMIEVIERQRRNDERQKEIDAIEKEISLLLTGTLSSPKKTGLYRHPGKAIC